jgi:hypothetical protein
MVENSIHTIESSQEIVSFESFQNGGSVTVEKNFDPKDFAGNKKVAKLLAQIMGDSVSVRKHVDANNFKNPELLINGKLADRKTPDYRAYKSVVAPIKNLTVKAQEQGAVHTVIELSQRYDKGSVLKGLKLAFYYADNMQVVDVVLKYTKIIRLTRKDYIEDTLLEKLSDHWVD